MAMVFCVRIELMFTFHRNVTCVLKNINTGCTFYKIVVHFIKCTTMQGKTKEKKQLRQLQGSNLHLHPKCVVVVHLPTRPSRPTGEYLSIYVYERAF